MQPDQPVNETTNGTEIGASKYTLAMLLADHERAKRVDCALEKQLLNRINTIVAETAEELYRSLKSEMIDALLVEEKMEGWFTGTEILEKMRKEGLCPHATILLTEENPAEEIAEMVVALIEQEEKERKARVAINQEAYKLVSSCRDISPPPELVVKLASYLGEEENIFIADLAKDIANDARTAAELMRLINSSAIGVPRTITSVERAVLLLGIKKTVSLILSATVMKSQNAMCNGMKNDDRTWYSKRSVTIASTAHSLAKNLGNTNPDKAYILGLFQEIGIPVMASTLGRQYQQVLNRAREKGILRLDTVERNTLGYTHADVGAGLLQKWGLPGTLIRPVARHHDSEDCGGASKVEKELLHHMNTAEALANLEGGKHTTQRYSSLKKLLDGYEQPEACNKALAEAVQKAAESMQLFTMQIDERELEATIEDIRRRITAA